MKRFILVLLLCCLIPAIGLAHTEEEEAALTLGQLIPLPEGMHVAEDGTVENGIGVLFLESGDLETADASRELMFGMMAVQNDALGDIGALLDTDWTQQDVMLGLMQRNLSLEAGDYTLSDGVDAYTGLAYLQMTVDRDGEKGLYRSLFDGETAWLFMAAGVQALDEGHVAVLETFMHSALDVNPMRRIPAERESIRADMALISAVIPMDVDTAQDREGDGSGEWILQRMRGEEAVQTLGVMYMSQAAAQQLGGGAARRDILESALVLTIAGDDTMDVNEMVFSTRESAKGLRQTAMSKDGMAYLEAWWDADGSLMVGVLQRKWTPYTQMDMEEALGMFDTARKVEGM